LWLDVRRAQDPARAFGPAPSAAWTALREVIPLMPDAQPAPAASDQTLAARFLRLHPAAQFFAGERP
jgi:histidine ammonia-lyase